MRKIVVSACAVLTAGMLSAAVYADTPRSEEFPNAAITLNFTPEFENTKGVIIPYGGIEVGGGQGIYETALLYFALDQEEYDRLSASSGLSDEDHARFQNSYAPVIYIITGDNGLTFEDISEMSGGSLDPAAAQPICTVGDCTHYLYNDPGMVLPEETDAAFVEEFEALKAAAGDLLDSSEFGNSKDPLELIIGSKLQFETTDIEGNPVKSEDLFGSHEITMLNIWASWCGFCIDEMEELEAINGRLAEKDCAVVGLLADGNEEKPLASGKETLKEKGVTYTNILPPDNFQELFYIPGYPTTYFVNREGIVIDTPIAGAYIDKYEPTVDALLSGDESAAGDLLSDSGAETPEEAEPAARIDTNEDSVYRIIVVDEDGNPVPEVTVQFCSDTACMIGETDETGTAEFRQPEGHYTVHILDAPEEYQEEENEFTLEAYSDLTIILFRA